MGIWDGHDSGAALLHEDDVVFAINEERLTRRKLEIHFPQHSIQACLQFAGITPGDVGDVAYTTTDVAKTLTRAVPSLKEAYYQIRRRKLKPTFLTPVKKRFKYHLTQWGPSALTRFVSDRVVRSQLKKLGFDRYTLHCVDHHRAHAAGAFFSDFQEALVVTVDGIGDGLSGSVYRYEKGQLTKLQQVPGSSSFGIFYEHVTNLMNMRELEDEGKVMALANFAHPVPDHENPMMSLIQVQGTTLHGNTADWSCYRRLQEVLWKYPSEQFCYMAQRVLEVRLTEWIQNLLREYKATRLVFSGGVASNVKANRLLRNLKGLEDMFVFPHMGDGGQAMGAAAIVRRAASPGKPIDAHGYCTGPAFSNEQVEAVIKEAGLASQRESDIVGRVADVLAKGHIVMWFHGRMELGPRALGGRSILALPNSLKIKDELNLRLKKRVWYQPFCPSMLEDDAKEVLADFGAGHPDRYMTSAYLVKENYRDRLVGVLNVDGTCRPQIIPAGAWRFATLLQKIKERTGLGILLNTSLNIHGQPLACTPGDALKAFQESGVDYLALEDFWVSREA